VEVACGVAARYSFPAPGVSWRPANCVARLIARDILFLLYLIPLLLGSTRIVGVIQHIQVVQVSKAHGCGANNLFRLRPSVAPIHLGTSMIEDRLKSLDRVQ